MPSPPLQTPKWPPATIGLCLLGFVGGPGLVRGDTVALTPVADTSLIETAPDHNLGGELFVPAGVTQNRTRAHGLFRFDLTFLAPQSRIVSASLILQVTGQPKDGYTPTAFDLHRVLEPWGEGGRTAEFSNHPGMGAPATTNEATWTHRFAFTTNVWTVPGAGATNDYAPGVSAEQFIYDVGNSPYAFGPTPAMTADVQAWLDHPETNFGWLLMAADETANFTARRFASREDTNNTPQLVIEFMPPPRLVAPQITGGRFTFSFTADAGQAYAVEYRNAFGAGAWTPLTNYRAQATTLNIVASDSIFTGQRCYRVAATNTVSP
ncbi:MAG: DNRLRE domain-containing protein [Limisphaerales bacterium]